MTSYTSALGTQYTLRLDVTLVSQNPSANKSKVAWVLTAIKNTGTGYWNFADTAWSVNIGGNVASGVVGGYDFRDYRQLVIASGQYSITHGENGTKSIAVSGTWDPDNAPALAEATVTSGGSPFVLPSLSRASQPHVSPSPATVGSDVLITWTAVDPAYVHNVTWTSGDLFGTIASASLIGSISWTVPDVMDEYPDKTQAPIVITIETFDEDGSLGTVSVTLMARDNPSVTDPDNVPFPFDVRARLVTYIEGDGWKPRSVIPASVIELVDPLSATSTCSITVSRLVMEELEDYSVVDIEVQNGTSWVSIDQRFVLTRVEEDSRDLSETVTYSGTNFVDFILGMGYLRADHEWEDVSPGKIMVDLFGGGHDRDWGPRVRADFTSGSTGMGTAWTNPKVSRKITAGTPFAQILEGLVEDGIVEYRTTISGDYVYLQLLNPGSGSDWAVAGSDPVVDLTTVPLTSAPRRGTREDVITRVTVQGNGTLKRTRERDADDPDVFGQLEGWVSASGIGKKETADKLGDKTLAAAKAPTDERTFVFSANAVDRHVWPYFSVRTGDWILVPGRGDNDHERVRVGQITLQRDTDGDVTVTILTGDRIISGTGALAKRAKAQTGGAIPGGNLTDPATINDSIPSAPVITSVTSEGYWDSDGAARSAVEIAWGVVESSIAGSGLDVDLYEVWWRPDVATPWALLVASFDLSVVTIGWDVLKDIQLRVRARSTDGIFGEWSLYTDYLTLAPLVDLDGPDLADLYTDGVGTIYAVWGGFLGTDPAPLRLAYVTAEVSSDEGVSYATMGTPLVAAGAIVISPGAFGEYYVRLRGYDRLGNAGDVSDPQIISITDPHLNPEVPATPTDLAGVAGAGWDSNGFLPEAWIDLTWTDVEDDTNGNPINVVGYDVWGNEVGEAALRFITSTPTNAVRVPVIGGSSWVFRVKASSDFGGVSDFSDAVEVDADATIAVAPAPDAPTLSQYAGILRILWSGNGMQPYIKYVYATISTSPSGPFTRAGMPLNGAGEVVVPGLATATTYYAKIVMVDEMGQTSTSAASAGLELDPITGITIQTSPVANTGIKMTNGGLTSYDESGNPTFILDAGTGEVWIAPYDAVFELGASGAEAETGDPTTGIAISSESSSFNTFIHPSGVQIRNDQTPLSWWEADALDASLVNFFSPRAVVQQRLMVGDYEMLREAKTTGTRLVIRYKGA